MITYVLFAVGLVFLLKGGDLLVDGASALAQKFNISPIVIGLTVVAFGTSAPELIVNILAANSGNTEIAIGNVLGSNIANIFLVLGIAALIHPIAAKRNTVLKEIPLSLLAALFVGLAANDALFDGAAASVFSRIDGLVCFLFMSIFMYYVFSITKSEEDILETDIPLISPFRASAYVGLGLVALFAGGKWVVDGAVKMAGALGVSQSLIGLTIVAVGTSLPELITSAVAAYKHKADIAIGNVVGSNIFNVFFVLGSSSIIRPLPFNPNDNGDIFVVILASIVLFWFMYIGRKRLLERWQGGMLLSCYIAYLIYVISVKG
ncbi:MAG: calcium/sodium antiporter [Saprospiraceae bacterium]|jgi:cation:H+ antiporter|nr:calcium/sodium antiporter [Saprospiraceae bacterium]MBP9210824.1 calcium/sodium antiporter [Saprospiraceae bacterium]MBV6472681.1 Inner membrane protein YrbG [Saprospiraceae bacterium]